MGSSPLLQCQEFVDARQKAWCIHCGRWISDIEINRDHVPSKSILLKPYPPNLPVIQVCKECNQGFSLDEEYFVAFLGSVLAGSTDPARQQNITAARILTRNPKLKTRIDRARVEFRTLGGTTRVFWKPEPERVSRVIVKNARGHVFFEYGEPMLHTPEHIGSVPLECLTREQIMDFENVDNGSAWPEVGSRMMTRVMTGQDLEDGWVIVQDGVYRYAIARAEGILVRTVLFEYLATEVYWNY